MAMIEIERNGRCYCYDPLSPGYYGVRVTPGSPEDTSAGRVGYRWVYLRYADDPADAELIQELRALLPEFRAIEDAEERAREERRLAALGAADERQAELEKNGLCPKCGTFCYGDCEAAEEQMR